jgi:hypothetical protein
MTLPVAQTNVAYLLKARAVEAEKQPLLGNGSYTRSIGTRHVRCDITQQWKRCCKRRSLWVHGALIATQLCDKHITAALNQHATIANYTDRATAACRLSISHIISYIIQRVF